MACGCPGIRVGPVINSSSWNNSFLHALITEPINYNLKSKKFQLLSSLITSLFLLEYIPRCPALVWPPRCSGTTATLRYQLVRRQIFRVPAMSQAYSPRAVVRRASGRWGAWGPELWRQLNNPLAPPAAANQGSEGLEEGTCEPLDRRRVWGPADIYIRLQGRKVTRWTDWLPTQTVLWAFGGWSGCELQWLKKASY